MSDTTATPVKKTARTRKTTVSEKAPSEEFFTSASSKNVKVKNALFSDLIETIADERKSFETLQKEIAEIRESWGKEQQQHQQELRARDEQEAVERKREQEAYEYETAKKRRQEEDGFLERKTKWERELSARKEALEENQKELEALRKQAEGFDTTLQKTAKEAQAATQKELTDQFANERKLREQEFKSEKELLSMKITNLTSDNTRQAQEVEALKKALDATTTQLKDVAVRVIESAKPQPSQKLPLE